MQLPQQFKELVCNVWGENGTLWLQNLPTLIEHFRVLWHLENVIPFENLSYNFVARAYSALLKKNVVLKIGIPSHHLTQEVQALKAFNGNGCVKLLEYDGSYGGILIELAQPGTTARTLFPYHDDMAVNYACTIIKRLQTARINNKADFPTMEQWLSLFSTLTVPEKMQPHVQKAALFAQELRNTEDEEYLLHGDLHHDNILLNGQDCIAIDPKGVLGEPAYEVGAFMCNPAELSEQRDLESIMAHRIALFSELLGIERQRLIKAVYVRIVLSACWTVQDNGSWFDDIRFAEKVIEL